MPESRQLLRAHAGLTARTFQNIIDHIDFGDFVSVCQPDAADFALPQQVIGRMTADAQHGLQMGTYRFCNENVRLRFSIKTSITMLNLLSIFLASALDRKIRLQNRCLIVSEI